MFLERMILMDKKDGHIHTPYCPHGTKDKLEAYIEQAIKEEFTCITFTEHAPLPLPFTDPTPMKDSAMKLEDMEDYIMDIGALKDKYRNKITINIGLEVDYIKEYEAETKEFLNKYGKYIDDSILSVHFLKFNGSYYCLDYDEKTFGMMIDLAGSLQNLYQAYYQAVLHSIQSNLGKFKPKRIGHITLINKFQKMYPSSFSIEESIKEILQAVKGKNLEIDYNVAGLRKEFCGETYPSEWIAKMAIQQNIPLIYGSDAHSSRDVGKHYIYYEKLANG
jgi:histidinol-phosphatase (PHP family)